MHLQNVQILLLLSQLVSFPCRQLLLPILAQCGSVAQVCVSKISHHRVLSQANIFHNICTYICKYVHTLLSTKGSHMNMVCHQSNNADCLCFDSLKTLLRFSVLHFHLSAGNVSFSYAKGHMKFTFAD